MGARLVQAIEENPDLSDKKYISELNRLVDPSGYDDSAKMVLRGSLYQLQLISEYYVDRVIEAEKREIFVDFVREELVRAILSMCEIADTEFAHLEQHGTLKDMAS